MEKRKQHFAVLDGLRGTAAILVIIFHLTEAVFPNPADNPLHHAYLAVDFFFMLSGFVIGYAYDDRWNTMSIKQFLRIRLIRLHPLVILGTVIGVLGYVFDPYVGDAQTVSILKLLLVTGLSLLLIPSPSLPNRYTETHSLNGPAWSLFQEYLVNILYALIGRRLGKWSMLILLFVSGAVLTGTAIHHTFLGAGWGWDTLWIAPVRLIFPFFAGLYLYRIKARIRLPFAFLLLSLLLGVVFALPYFTYNGLYEAFCIIIVFPIIIAAGATEESSGRLQSTCDFFGRISYPIYILHYPFIYIYTHWYYSGKVTTAEAIGVGAGLVVFFIVISWLVVRFYDEPVRQRLQKIWK